MSIKKLSEALLSIPATGHCSIDREKALKLFSRYSFISRYHDEYTLCDTTLTDKVRLKVSISPADAEYLINALNLRTERSAVFRHARTYRK